MQPLLAGMRRIEVSEKSQEATERTSSSIQRSLYLQVTVSLVMMPSRWT